MKLPRGQCPVCRQDVAVRRGGEIREHRARSGAAVCKGSGKPAAKPLSERLQDALDTNLARDPHSPPGARLTPDQIAAKRAEIRREREREEAERCPDCQEPRQPLAAEDLLSEEGPSCMNECHDRHELDAVPPRAKKRRSP